MEIVVYIILGLLFSAAIFVGLVVDKKQTVALHKQLLGRSVKNNYLYKKGYVFSNPNDHTSGFVLTRSVYANDPVLPSDLAPFGSEKAPVVGEQMPMWLQQII